MSFYFTIIACQFHCINIRNFITLNVWGKYKRSFFVIVTVLFTKPSSSILPAVGMTSETVPAAGPIHGLQCYSQSCWFLSYWPFPKNCWPEHPQRPFLPVAPIDSQWTLFCSTGIVPVEIMEWPGTMRPATLWIALLIWFIPITFGECYRKHGKVNCTLLPVLFENRSSFRGVKKICGNKIP